MKFKFILLLISYWFLNSCSTKTDADSIKESMAITKNLIGEWILYKESIYPVNEMDKAKDRNIEECIKDNIIDLRDKGNMSVNDNKITCPKFVNKNGVWLVEKEKTTNNNIITINHSNCAINKGVYIPLSDIGIMAITYKLNKTSNDYIVNRYMKKPLFLGVAKLNDYKKNGVSIIDKCAINNETTFNLYSIVINDIKPFCTPLASTTLKYKDLDIDLSENEYTITLVDNSIITISSIDIDNNSEWRQFKLSYKKGNDTYEEFYRK